jgi:hypothetical protein
MGEVERETPGDRALSDLHRVVRGALASSGSLLTQGERVLAGRMLALHGPPGRLWIRLVARRSAIQRVDGLQYPDVGDVPSAIAQLIAQDLAHASIPWSQRRETLTVPELKGVLRGQGLPLKGRRADLLERAVVDPGGVACVRVVGRGLIRRLERLWFRSVWRDRTGFLLERLGQVQFVPHPVTAPEPAFPTRAAMRELERALVEPMELERALAQVEARAPRGPAFRALDVRRLRVEQAREALREMERAGEHLAASQGYRRLLDAGLPNPGPVAQRLALALDRAGHPGLGAHVCADVHPLAAPADQPALARTGRRLARKAHVSWRATTPLRKPPERHLYLERTPGTNRPLWGPKQELVEAAVMRALTPRVSLFAENALWTTLFGLAFADLYFLPIPGVLPTPMMDGPLDLGSSAFFDARRAEIQARLDELLAAPGPVLLRNWARFEGQQVRGVYWALTTCENLTTIAEAGRSGLVAVLGRMLREGWRVSAGLPDLAVLPGTAHAVHGAIPAMMDPGLVLIEVKGRGDRLRDEQRVWHDVLQRAGLRVEIWRVEPQSPATKTPSA